MFYQHLEHVSLSERRQVFFTDFHNSYPAGYSIAITGGSRSGKTTFLLLAAGYIKPSAGRVYLTVDRERLPMRPEWCGVGPMENAVPLFDRLTVYQHLQIQAGLYRVEQIERRITELLYQWNLYESANKRLRDLDRFTFTRAAIAGALVHRPRVLLLDEPDRGLSEPQWAEIWSLLQNMHNQEEMILWLTTVSSRTARHCDEVVEMPMAKIKGS